MKGCKMINKILPFTNVKSKLKPIVLLGALGTTPLATNAIIPPTPIQRIIPTIGLNNSTIIRNNRKTYTYEQWQKDSIDITKKINQSQVQIAELTQKVQRGEQELKRNKQELQKKIENLQEIQQVLEEKMQKIYKNKQDLRTSEQKTQATRTQDNSQDFPVVPFIIGLVSSISALLGIVFLTIKFAKSHKYKY